MATTVAGESCSGTSTAATAEPGVAAPREGVVKAAAAAPEESPARRQRIYERVQLEDLNGRLQQYIMKQRAKDASREVWQRDLRAVQDRAGAAISTNTKKYEDYLRLMRQQRDEHASAREELQVRVSRQDATIVRLKEQLEQEKQFQEDLSERVTRLSKELETRSAQVVQLQEAERVMQHKAKAAEATRAQLQHQLDEARAGGEGAEQEVSAMRARCKSLEQDLEIRAVTAREEQERLEAQIEELTRANTDVEDTVREEFASQLAEIVEDYRKQCSDDKTRITRELKAHYMPKLAEARSALERVSQREQELRDANALLAEDRAALKSQVELLADTKASLEKRVRDVEMALDDARNHAFDAEAMRAKDDEMRRLRREHAQLEDDFDKLMDVKIQLVLEIEKYSQLLEEEESRLGLPTPGKKRKRARMTPGAGDAAAANKAAAAMVTPKAARKTAAAASHELLLELDAERGCMVLSNPQDRVVALRGWALQSRAIKHAFAFGALDEVAARGALRVWVGDQQPEQRRQRRHRREGERGESDGESDSDEDVHEQEDVDSDVDEAEDAATLPSLVWEGVDPKRVAQDEVTLVDDSGNVVDSIAAVDVKQGNGDATCLIM